MLQPTFKPTMKLGGTDTWDYTMDGTPEEKLTELQRALTETRILLRMLEILAPSPWSDLNRGRDYLMHSLFAQCLSIQGAMEMVNQS